MTASSEGAVAVAAFLLFAPPILTSFKRLDDRLGRQARGPGVHSDPK